MGLKEKARRRATHASKPADAGFNLVEIIVAVLLIGVVMTVGTKTFMQARKITSDTGNQTAMWAETADLQTAVGRDVEDATNISVASAQKLTLSTVRDGDCNVRSYDLTGASWTITTVFYVQEKCAGPSETRVDTIVRDLGKDGRTVPAETAFTYFNADGKAITADPVTDRRRIKRVEWRLAVQLAGQTTVKARVSGAAYSGYGDASGTGTQNLVARTPLLSITTGDLTHNRRVGIDAPILGWSDSTASVTGTYTVLRAASLDSTAGGGAAATWTEVGVNLPSTTTSWTDTSAQPGYTYVYVVRATLTDGTQGPSSNQAVTGLAPIAPTGVTAAGQPTSIKVDWARALGANAYDLYRDGVLLVHVGDVATYTDNTGYGHSHNYEVVAINRWERGLMNSGDLSGMVAIGHDKATALYTPGAGVGTGKREFSSAAGAFSAPAAPTLTATPNADWSSTLTWTPAPWVGAGPTTVGSVHRDRGWQPAVNGASGPTASGAWSNLGAEIARTTSTYKHQLTQATVAGQYRHYQAETCNAVGCSPDSTAVTTAQRPPTPTSCVASASSTRAATVTVNPTGAGVTVPNTGSTVTGGTPVPGYGVAGIGTQGGYTFGVDQLRHSTGQTFTAVVNNGTGASDPVTCSTTTSVLGISGFNVNTVSSRRVDASFAPTNGSSRWLTIDNASSTSGTSASWGSLYHTSARNFLVEAFNSDGIQAVTTAANAWVPMPAAPGPPGCSLSGVSDMSPGALTANGGDVARLNGGADYSSPHGWSGLGAGSYTASTANTNSDGVNTSRSTWTNCPSVTVKNEIIWGGSGTASASCAPYRGLGDVMDGLSASLNGYARAGTYLAGPYSGSFKADYGEYVSGPVGADGMMCSFYRKHEILWTTYDFDPHAGWATGSVAWVKGGATAN